MIARLSLRLLLSKSRELVYLFLIIIISLFVIVHQMSSYKSVMAKTYALVGEMPEVDLWAVGFNRESILKLRTFEEVQVTSPICVGKAYANPSQGEELQCQVIGLDERTMLGAPKKFVMGGVDNLKLDGGILIGESTLKRYFSYQEMGEYRFLKPGSQIRFNGKTFTIVGVFKEGIEDLPRIYTTFSRARQILDASSITEPPYLLIKGKQGSDLLFLSEKIKRATGLDCYLQKDLTKLIYKRYLQESNIPLQFSWVVFLGFGFIMVIMATAFSGICFLFRSETLVWKAMGTSEWTIALFYLIEISLLLSLAFLTTLILYLPLSIAGILAPLSIEVCMLSLGCLIALGGILSLIVSMSQPKWELI